MLDWTPNTRHTGVYVSQKLGYYKEAGWDVQIIKTSEDGANMAVATGKAEFGVGFQETLAPALTADSPLPIRNSAAMIDHNTLGLIFMEDQIIKDFKALEGKTTATVKLSKLYVRLDTKYESYSCFCITNIMFL